MYVRSTFAAIEALSFFLKQHAFNRQIVKVFDSFKTDRPDLRCRELSLLIDESYTLKDNGKPKTNKAKLRTVPNLLFALSAFGEAIGSQHDLLKDAGYNAVIKAVKIRDQLMHPKNPEALHLTHDQIATVKSAFAWVRRELTQIINSAPGVTITEIELHNKADAGDVL
jgi:hypothetical protein